MTKTILDATAWLNFARADSIDMLVSALSGQGAVGLLVERHEMLRWPNGSTRRGQPFSFKPYLDAGDLELAIMSQAEMAHFHETKTKYHLGDGETEALVIALSRGWRVATDDGPARKRFGAHNPPVTLTGTIGLLRELVRGSAITKADATTMLDLMRRRGGRLPNEDI
jgi:hypothetical protein